MLWSGTGAAILAKELLTGKMFKNLICNMPLSNANQLISGV